MFCKQLALRFVLCPLLPELGDSHNLCDSFRESSRESRGSHEVFVRPLRVGGYEADCGCSGGIEGVWECDLGGLEALLVNDMLFGREC